VSRPLRIVDGRPGRFWVDDALIDAPIRFYSKLVYCTLARLVRGTEIKISRLDLARLADLGLSSVKRGLAELEKTGWIEIIQSGGMKVENTYRLLGRPALMVQPGPSMVQPEPSTTVQPGPSDGSARTGKATTEEAKAEEAERSKAEVQQNQEQHLAPRNGAARLQATQGVLLESAVAVDAEGFEEAPPVPRPRPAGGTHVAASAPGAPDPAATPPRSPAAARGPVPRDLLIAFDRAYTARFGVRHPKMGGQEAALAKGLLEQYGLPKCLEFVEAFFTLQDAWLERTGKGFKIFAMANTITKLIALPTAVSVGRPASISEKWAGAKPGLVSL